ncbi:MAG TPA: hypothetical protein VHF67_13630 [Gaiellaceae bacterium]|nr:hypothetical protein [Gaiellaceae bacterium]
MATHRLFRFLSRERRQRIFHPVGIAFVCEVRLEDGAFGAVGTHAGLIRFSRALGVPAPLPDVLGVALRIAHAHGSGAHQDILLASSLAGFVPAPTRTFFGPAFSSLLPYRVDRRLALLVARAAVPGAVCGSDALAGLERAADETGVRFRFSVIPGSRPVGEIVVLERLTPGEAARLRLNPYNTGPRAIPVGLPNRLRDPAYRGSQAGRPMPR